MGVSNGSLKVDDADKGHLAGQRKGSGSVKSQTYQGAETNYK